MTLVLEPDLISREVLTARKKQTEYLKSWKRIVERAAGPHHSGKGGATGAKERETINYGYRWMTYVVPQLVFHSPRVALSSPSAQDLDGELARLEVATNRWILDNHFGDFLARYPALDMQFGPGYVYASSDPVPGARPIEGIGTDTAPGDPTKGASEPRIPWSPKVYRVAPLDYFEDGLAETQDEIRFRGHVYWRDINDIEKEGAEGGWDTEAIAWLKQKYASGGEQDPEGGIDVAQRARVSLADIWVIGEDLDDEHTAEQGFNGIILTVLISKYDSETMPSSLRGKWIRKPRAWYGPPEGPYEIFGASWIPSSPKPVAPLMATEQEARELNIDHAVKRRMMRDYKRMVLLTQYADDQDLQVLRDGKHEHFYKLRGVRQAGDVITSEVGGLTPLANEHVEQSRRDYEATLGLSEMHAGAVSGVGTATEQTIANSAGQVRFDGIQDAFLRGVKGLMRKIVWFMHEDTRTHQRLGPEDLAAIVDSVGPQMAAKMGITPVVTTNQDGQKTVAYGVMDYLGGRRGKGLPIEAISVEIEPYSMSRQSEAKRAALASTMIETAGMLVPLAAAYPGFPWQKFTQRVGELLQLPRLGDYFADPSTFGAPMQQQPFNGGKGAPPPPAELLPLQAGQPGAGGTRAVPSGGGRMRTARTPGQQTGSAIAGRVTGATRTRARLGA